VRIGINATYAVLKNKTGVGLYTLNLIQNLASVDKKNEYVLYYNKGQVKRNELLKINKPNFKHKFFFPKLIKFCFDNLDIFHEPAFRYLKPAGTKTVVTIHDITSVLKYDFMSEKFRKYANKKLEKSILKADKIIAVSKNTKKDILQYFNVSPDRIAVVYHGISDKFKILPNKKELKKILESKYNLTGKYILSVGTIETRKNIANLVFSYVKIKGKIKDVKLVLIGGQGYGYGFLSRLIKEMKEYDVIYYQYLEHNDLPLFYNCAEVFVYPSFYEGFGLPVLEAMKCGVPVVTSKNSALSEIGKKYVHYVDPFNLKSIGEGILKILKDKDYANSLSKMALKYVERFNWQKTARKTIKIYEETLTD